MDMSIGHFTIEAPAGAGLSSEVIKLDMLPRNGDKEIGIYDLLDLLKVVDPKYTCDNGLDLEVSDYSRIFLLFERLKHLAG
ncbi:hypothetical protein LLH00_17365 [bacterium]|nr:hypothetical protein [bacterium]